MATGFSKLMVNCVLMLMIALAATSCGRRGNLEAPPNASVVTVDENGEELPEPVTQEDKPFILDPLL
ncbi:MAG: hypothetical protein AAF478_06025 [Pseudomonadota bacterium]